MYIYMNKRQKHKNSQMAFYNFELIMLWSHHIQSMVVLIFKPKTLKAIYVLQ